MKKGNTTVMRICNGCKKKKPIKEFARRDVHTRYIEDDFLFCNECIGI